MAVDITPLALLEFAKTLKGGADRAGSARVATVTRIDDDGVAYVALPGGVNETPIATNGASFEIGDTVFVSMAGGKLRADSNLSQPSVGARIVTAATKPIERAVKVAKQAADEAGRVANAVNQHFWNDDNGAHVTDVTKDAWAAAVADNFSDLSDDKQYPNLLMNSLGILLRSALNNLVSITRSAIAFYDGLGNNAANIVAQFGTNGAQIGYVDESHMELDYHSMQLIDKDGDAYFHVSDLRDMDGYVTDEFTGDGSTKTFDLTYYGDASQLQTMTVCIDGSEVSEGVSKWPYYVTFDTAPALNSEITVKYIPLSPEKCKAFTLGTRAEGGRIGTYSYSEGYQTTSDGWYTHAEGKRTVASYDASHAEGAETRAIGLCSHAEGYSSHAEGSYSHAEGYGSIAQGNFSHASGLSTKALRKSQTVIGEYNDQDSQGNDGTERGKYVFIVGNGTANGTRSNAAALQWDGTLELASALPIASGGSGQTGTTTTSSANSIIGGEPGVTFDGAYYAQWGKFAMTTITFQVSSAKSGSWTMGTMANGKKPAIYCRGITSSTALTTYISTGGVITMYGSLSANTACAVTFTYLLA